MTRVPQPPVNPVARDREHHDFWPGFIAALAGLIVMVCGARHLTGLDTADGGTAWETQLVRAFSFGGLQYASKVSPPAPPKLDDPAAQAEAMERWSKEQAGWQPPAWKVRVDTAAKTPCPT